MAQTQAQTPEQAHKPGDYDVHLPRYGAVTLLSTSKSRAMRVAVTLGATHITRQGRPGVVGVPKIGQLVPRR